MLGHLDENYTNSCRLMMRCLGRVKLVRRIFYQRCIDVLHCESNNGLNNNEVRNGLEQCGYNAYKMIITTMLFEQI